MPRPITLTYTLYPAHGPQRAHLLDALTGVQAQLPLRNLHWKSATRTSLRTIQEVDVQLVELGEMGPQREVGGSVMDGALVNLCMVACDDAEVYKTSTKSFIRDWLSLLSSRRNVYAPLIVLVNPPSVKDTGKNVFGRDKGILGKLRADFNVAKRDRCVQVNLPSGNVADPAAWPEVITRLKESIISAFDAAIMDREEEVKRGEAQRLTVGWNFCSWFLLKESLAHSFEGVGLHEDALTVYEELDATFLQILKEQNLSWFGKLGATGPRDDSLPILDVGVKPYREMLQHSAISVFDFRVYVFARQAVLLGKLGRITEVAKRGQWFVASLARRLRESEGDLAEHFIESWTYTACIDIVHRCDEWSRVDRPNGDYSGLIAYESARSELLDIARVQVERLGVAVGHLPDRYPFAAPKGLLPESDDVLFETSDGGISDDGDASGTNAAGDGRQSESRPRPSNPLFLDALRDESKFRTLYIGATRKAMAAYEACGKANSVVRLKVALAAVALHTRDWKNAFDLARSLVRDCAEQHAWTPVQRYALTALVRAHEALGAARDAEWAGYAVGLIRASAAARGVDERAESAVAAVLDDEAGLEKVLEGLKGLDEEFEVDDLEAFAIRLESLSSSISDGRPDLLECRIAVQSHLDEDIEVDHVELVFEDADGTAIRFVTDRAVLELGANALVATCPGLFHLSSATIVLGNTRFRYTQLETGSRLAVRRNPAGLKTELRVPRHVALDQASRVVLHLSSGECEMQDVRIRAQSLTGDVYIDLESAQCQMPIQSTPRHVGLQSVAPGQDLQIALAYRGTPQSEMVHAQIVISYSTRAGEARDYVDVLSVFVGLPLTVNVQDFFRAKSMTSHFTIASDGREFLRVKSVELGKEDAQGYEVKAAGRARRQSQGEVIITPDRPLSTLFNVRPVARAASAQAASGAGPAVLRLVIKYRNLAEEVYERYQAATQAVSSAEILSRDQVAERLGDRRVWLSEYAVKGSLPGVADLVLASTDDLEWQTLEIPVEVPTKRLIISARIEQARPTDGPVYEGRALEMRLCLRVGFAWSGWAGTRARAGAGAGAGAGVDADADANADTGPASRTPVQELAFDVLPNPDEWIVLGRKKGSWSATADAEHTVDLVLVPMRAGVIALPNLIVHPTPRSRSRSNTGGAEDGEAGASAAAGVDSEVDLLCETYLENAAEVVHVLPARREMTAVVPVGYGVGPSQSQSHHQLQVA